MTAPMVDYKIHWLKMMSVPESRAVVGRHDGINGRDNQPLSELVLCLTASGHAPSHTFSRIPRTFGTASTPFSFIHSTLILFHHFHDCGLIAWPRLDALKPFQYARPRRRRVNQAEVAEPRDVGSKTCIGQGIAVTRQPRSLRKGRFHIGKKLVKSPYRILEKAGVQSLLGAPPAGVRGAPDRACVRSRRATPRATAFAAATVGERSHC